MKVIFLDFDGVITVPPKWYIKADKIKYVKKIVDKTDAKIVVSSSYRAGCPPTVKETIESMGKRPKRCPKNRMLNWLLDNLYDCTPCYSYGKYKILNPGRGGEIEAWLNAHPEVKNYVIIDDDNDMLDSQLYHFVQTNFEDGITEVETKRAIKVLNENYFQNSMALNFELRYEHLKRCNNLPNKCEELEKYNDLCKDIDNKYEE